MRGLGVPVQAGISTSFGCPFEGDVPLDRLEWVVRRLVDMGARAIGVADTTGMANPRQVARTLEHLMPRFPGVEWTLHTHDTRAMAIPHILAALEMGIDLDAGRCRRRCTPERQRHRHGHDLGADDLVVLAASARAGDARRAR